MTARSRRREGQWCTRGEKNRVSILGGEAGRRGREGGPRGGAASDGRNLSR